MSTPVFSIPLNNKVWQTITKVHREVNRLPYKADIELYESPEFWTEISSRGGDCEDYAIGKRNRLIAAGLDPRALNLCTCRDETGAGHAVLLIDAQPLHTHGRHSTGPDSVFFTTLVLDNRFPSVMNWESLVKRGYWFDRRQLNGLNEWHKVINQ